MEKNLTVAERLKIDGFCGPLDSGLPAELLHSVAKKAECIIEKRSVHSLYGRYSVRDWHLTDAEFLKVLTAEPIVAAVKALLGENILLWRSKIFLKTPGEGELGWHQEWGAFNGEEIGNDKPALIPSQGRDSGPWNYTVWVALEDVTIDMGPIRFAQGSNIKRYPIEMRNLKESEFFLDPFIDITDKDSLIEKILNRSLVLDIDTSEYLQGLDLDSISFEALKEIVMIQLDQEVGAVTLGFDESENTIVDLVMKAGQFVVFTERCMHGSSANRSAKNRIALNARFTSSDTDIYPFRSSSNSFDGSNLDVRHHKSVLVAGEQLNAGNSVVPIDEFCLEVGQSGIDVETTGCNV